MNAQSEQVSEVLENGTLREIDGKARVYYEGYWLRHYAAPAETMREKKSLIERLTRRAFHHTEPGINTPGGCLETARAAYLAETDPARKRVNAAMLAGALFNRATDIFTTLTNLGEKHVDICPDNELMQQCGQCLQEALELGKSVKHFSGHEGVDELWGEPMKAFTMSISDFYASRYLKIAWAMRDIDRLAAAMTRLAERFGYRDFVPVIAEFAVVCRQVCETDKSDPDHFRIWPRYVATLEKLYDYCDRSSSDTDLASRILEDDAYRVLMEGTEVISFIAGARVPMPKSMQECLDKAEAVKLRKAIMERASN